jgi:hypothetical protein
MSRTTRPTSMRYTKDSASFGTLSEQAGRNTGKLAYYVLTGHLVQSTIHGTRRFCKAMRGRWLWMRIPIQGGPTSRLGVERRRPWGTIRVRSSPCYGIYCRSSVSVSSASNSSSGYTTWTREICLCASRSGRRKLECTTALR